MPGSYQAAALTSHGSRPLPFMHIKVPAACLCSCTLMQASPGCSRRCGTRSREIYYCSDSRTSIARTAHTYVSGLARKQKSQREPYPEIHSRELLCLHSRWRLPELGLPQNTGRIAGSASPTAKVCCGRGHSQPGAHYARHAS